VLKAVEHVNQDLANALVGMDATRQREIDHTMIALDGSPNKAQLGANAIVATSLAAAKAAADAEAEALCMGAETFHALKSVLAGRGLNTAVGDEGGFAPNFASNEEAIQVIIRAIAAAGFMAGRDIALALDPAATSFYDEATGLYYLSSEMQSLHSAEMAEYYVDLCARYPIISLEDGLAEEDWEGWEVRTKRLGGRIQVVGDDIFVTNRELLARGIEQRVANSILIKLNQIWYAQRDLRHHGACAAGRLLIGREPPLRRD